jgi:hypothetical protein
MAPPSSPNTDLALLSLSLGTTIYIYSRTMHCTMTSILRHICYKVDIYRKYKDKYDNSKLNHFYKMTILSDFV